MPRQLTPFNRLCRMGDVPWRDGRVVEGARLESVYTGDRIGGSNPPLSAKFGKFNQSENDSNKSQIPMFYGLLHVLSWTIKGILDDKNRP